jgi:hypothetical protein
MTGQSHSARLPVTVNVAAALGASPPAPQDLLRGSGTGFVFTERFAAFWARMRAHLRVEPGSDNASDNCAHDCCDYPHFHAGTLCAMVFVILATVSWSQNQWPRWESNPHPHKAEGILSP